MLPKIMLKKIKLLALGITQSAYKILVKLLLTVRI